MDSIIDRMVAEYDVNTWVSFGNHIKRRQTLSKLNPRPCATSEDVSVATAQSGSAKNGNVAAILRGDGEFHFSCDSCLGFCSFDGTVPGFCPIIWESLAVTWTPKMHHYCIDWPYCAVSRAARLLRRQGKGPARPYVNIEGYPKSVAVVLMKNTLKRWLDNNPGLGILIGRTGARAPNTRTPKYFIRCFGGLRFRSSGRSCVVGAACNVAFLLLVDTKTLSVFSRFTEGARRASQRARPDSKDRLEISDFTSVGHLGPVSQELGGELSIKMVKILPPHGHREPPKVRFD